ncbi:lipopolysaccharide heptosyltransferase family protein [Sulfurimonas aquatica]|uniref:Lipopolysaccharide heptosyltransferase family protein n=1 Tax=Sulfurimonas aquatica TaxID=2672570 RepID=A0A975AZD8_9BACT|nr:glycosyltransferase family 9 protein [Sulfurimonas aquatica]QSZ41323.1 lipopolysaccharide heptosyltransferase family protein [Sulfurimonas aquatica]
MNILVVRTDKLGDFITALPAMYVLKKHDEKNRIIACVSAMNEVLARKCDFIDEVIVDNPHSSVEELSTKIKKQNIDASITLFSSTRVAFAQFLARIPIRIAPATKLAQVFYTHRVKQRRSQVKMAEFEYNLELTRELYSEINLEYKKPLLVLDDTKNVYDVFCMNNDIRRDIMAFHVGFGGSSDANWSTTEYEQLIRGVLKKKKYQVVMTFGPDEKKLYEEMQIRLRGEDVVFYFSLDGLTYFAKLISSFKLFVSTSTGTYHLASLVGCPTMTFFGDSLFASSSRWKSVGDIKLQKHFMLSVDEIKRQEMFDEVKKELIDY